MSNLELTNICIKDWHDIIISITRREECEKGSKTREKERVCIVMIIRIIHTRQMIYKCHTMNLKPHHLQEGV